MSLPEPRANPLLLGQSTAEAALLDAMRSGRIHHAWLIDGPEGVGKATLAFRFARRLLAGPAPGLDLDPADPVFRRVAAGSHADLLTVQRAWDEKRRRRRGEIVVDDVRRVADFLRLTPAEDGWRVVVLDGAEHLNRNAANALLKVLEEPPPRAVLLLTCAAPGRLLPTIRSRCRRLRAGRLGAADMERLLAAALPEMPEAERARLADLAEGSPGRALLLAEEEGLRIAGRVDEILAAAPAIDLRRAYALADELGRSDIGFSTFMDLLLAALARQVREAARASADAAGLAGPDRVWQALGRLQGETERFNLDKRQALVSAFALLNGSPIEVFPGA